MTKKIQLTFRLNEDLYKMVKFKCNQKFGIGISPLINIFLRAFVTQKGIGFYVGDDDLCHLFYKWFGKKKLEQGQGKNRARLPGPRLKDLYDLNDTPNKRRLVCQSRETML